MRIALLQLDLAWEDVAANHARAAKRLKEAADRGAALAILPEMFATGFSMDAARVAEAPGGPTETWLRSMARGLGLHVLAGVARTPPAGAADPRPRNEALLVSPDGELRRAAKLHPFSFAKEDRHYAAGDEVATWKVGDLSVTPLVCYDLRFPEPFRLAADETDLFAVLANWPDRRRQHWRTLARARAIENLCYVAAVNRVGDGDGLHYAGDTALISPWGETLASAAEEEAVLLADVDPAAVADARAKFPALADRKPSYRKAT